MRVKPILGIMILASYAAVNAGPPFITNDPVPETFKSVALYLFSNLDYTNIIVEEPYLNMAAVELDWGASDNLELSIVAPYTAANTNPDSARGMGDIQLGLTYRFIQETELSPQLSFVPQLSIPTGNADRNLGNGRVAVQLPVWLQKSWGSWTSYGGAGWTFNSAPGMRNYPIAGWLVQKDLNEKWTLGAELYTQGAVSNEGSASTALNLGGNYNFNQQFSLLFSAGHSIFGQEHTLAYLGLTWSLGE